MEMSENKDLGASAADATDRVGGLRPEPQDASQPSGRSPTGAWTPGPWYFRLEAVRTVIYHKAEIGEKAIAVGAGSYPDHIANARLIAAAPDLFEVCAALEAHIAALCEPASEGFAIRDRLSAALAKARGES